MSEAPDLPRHTILLCEVGSTAHGIDVGSDDRDEMGVCLEGPETTIGLGTFEQSIYRSAAIREGRHDARSQAGDLDRVIYSARKFCRLALKGNPSVQVLLFQDPIMATEVGMQLQDMRDLFASLRVVRAFMGYMEEQTARLEGRRGQKSVKRPELIERYGYDTKYAGHIIRLGMQGVAYATTGEIPVPLPPHNAREVRDVRTGVVGQADAIAFCALWRNRLEEAHHENAAGLPKVPDEERVSKWLVSAHRTAWEGIDAA